LVRPVFFAVRMRSSARARRRWRSSRWATRPGHRPARLTKDLSTVRKRRFAINNQLTEAGVTAIGVAVRGGTGEPLGALAIARFTKSLVPDWAEQLSAAVSRIETALTPKEF
jgi:DNA-binding IclR family transcriptional regulator